MVTKRPDELELVGGNVALDLANTLEGPLDAEPDTDHLRTPADLAAWMRHAGLEPPAEPTEALLDGARGLRAAIYAAFSAVATGGEPPRRALDALVEGAAGGRLRPAGAAPAPGTFTAAAAGGAFALAWDDPLGPVAQAAVDLLRDGPLERVKLCHVCRWLFLDTSRNRSRRWCSMNECGGRDKMRRYRARRATAGR